MSRQPSVRRRVLSVSQINEYIKTLFDGDILLSALFMEGEVSNLKYHSSGHIYFTLKDEFAALNCVLFKANALSLRFRLENGQKVVVLGRISVYPKTGQYQMYAEEIEPYGVGAVALAFEQLKERLSRAGLFDEARKRKINPYPKCVAVVTSKTGAALRDILTVSKRRNKSVKVLIIPVQVQGDGAARQIAEGIELANAWGLADTVIVSRGGGSMEDLWAFNEEIVAYAVFNSGIPVISAVGHETDFTICDFVSDLRAPTPSAAAEIAFPLLKTKEDEVKQRQEALTALAAGYLNEKVFENTALTAGLTKEMGFYLDKMKLLLRNKADNLENLSPLSVLRRGYSLVHKKDRLVMSVTELMEDDLLTISFHDGTAEAQIKKLVEISGKAGE